MPRPTAAQRRRTRRHRQILAGSGLLGALLVVGALLLLLRGPDREQAVKDYVSAWSKRDYPAMHALTSAEARTIAPSAATFARRFQQAGETATVSRMQLGKPVPDGDDFKLPVVARTRSFGPVRGVVTLKVVEEDGEARVDWRPYQVFPGLRAGDKLTREMEMAPRAALLARDGTPLAKGPERAGTVGPAAADIVGILGAIPNEQRQRAERLGYPADAKVGISGLERIFDEQLAGVPGGRLLAGTRVVAERTPEQAPDVRTSIVPSVQRAAVESLEGRLGGIAVIEPRTGEVLAAAGIGFSGLQPPGSTFKIITAAGALERGITKLDERFPIETAATLEGVKLNNSFSEPCGGTLVQSFAKSCNSVFAPLGAKLGAKGLVETARKFGFDHPIGIPGAATSTIPEPGEMGDDLATGSSAIGQGKVQATALQMAIVAATIALRGRRPEVTMQAGKWRRAPTTPAVSARTAAGVERMMLAVVRGGTGGSAAIKGVKVAGKTGTAELRSTDCTPDPANPEACPADGDPKNTDAWFSAYAPAGAPRAAVGVLLVGSGHGGTTAAPVAKTTLSAALKATG